MSLQNSFIGGALQGLETDVKPLWLQDQAWQTLYNAYVFRQRVRKREGIKLLGRLRRVLTATALVAISGGPGPFNYNIFTGLGLLATEPDAQLEPGNITIVIGAQTLTDITGTGVMTIAPAGNITAATLNYSTGVLTITATLALVAVAATFAGGYYPSLPVMGIEILEQSLINNESTIFFDTKYAYVNLAGGFGFTEFLPGGAGTTWTGNDSDFFWSANYRGATPDVRLFFVTNGSTTAGSQPRYTTGTANWVNFTPQLDAVPNFLFQERILIPYYGRLIALNTWEGPNLAGSVNYFMRARYSQIGNPIAADAWRSDIVGKGGFIDAPTGEAIVGAEFFKNTLIVHFERSTWQLRYVGEYGIPFIWERISSDFGSESTFSSVIFDDGVLVVGDKGIVVTQSIEVKRIDEKIPDTVFLFRNDQDGTKRVAGVRDFQKELVYWNYADSNFLIAGTDPTRKKFPNRVLVYNYRTQTWSINRDNVTAWGTLQINNNIVWARTDVKWNDFSVQWKDFDNQSEFPYIVSGNQEGFIHIYNSSNQVVNEPSLSITSVTITGVSPNQNIRLVIKNHNLEDYDIIYLTGLKFIDSPSNVTLNTTLNNSFFAVKVIDINTVDLAMWSFTQQQYFNNINVVFDPPVVGTATYVGGGVVTLFPVMEIQTKDFNPYQVQGKQVKFSSIDFLFDETTSGEVAVILYLDSSQSIEGNLLLGNTKIETNPYTSNAFLKQLNYCWHSFYATLTGQYINVMITYNDDQMNNLSIHQQPMVLNAMNIKHRPGGAITNG